MTWIQCAIHGIIECSEKATLELSVIALVLVVTPSFSPAVAQTEEDEIRGKMISTVLETVDQAVKESDAPGGLVVAVTDRSRTLAIRAFGLADRKANIPLTPDALFPIGSISKSFTAVALLRLYEDGRFDPHAPITTYLPGFEVRSEFEPITGHHLLTHTSGLPFYRTDLASTRYAAYAFRNHTQTFAPGIHYWYSNTGYQLLGYALEDIYKASYTDIVAREVFRPLGMNDSVAVIGDALRSRLPVSYWSWDYSEEDVEAPWFEYSAADASIASTAADMCAYARFILNRGQVNGKMVLSEEAFTLLTTPFLESYAYGLEIRKDGEETVVSHEGEIAGFVSLLETRMQDGIAVVLLSNVPLNRDFVQWLGSSARTAHLGEIVETPQQPLSVWRAPEQKGDAQDYVGVYRALHGEEMSFVVDNGTLVLEQANAATPLRQVVPNVFVGDRDLDLEPIIFGRADEGPLSDVIEVSQGSKWYARKGEERVMPKAAPRGYSAYVGHYVYPGPEGPNVRVFVRRGRLLLMHGLGARSGMADALEPLGDGVFKPLEPAWNPERYQFDALVGGRALRLRMSGVPLYRIDTP